MKAHIAHLRMRTPHFAYWRKVGSQAVQDLCERHEKVYANFFAKRGGLPRFKKVKKYSSFTLNRWFWKLHDAVPGKKHRKLTIGDTIYKLVYHRPMGGDIKTVTIKRDAAGRLWVCFSVVENVVMEGETSTGQSGGFDFGLKTFLTTHTGQRIDAPQFFSRDLPRFRAIQRQVSIRKMDGSVNKRKGKQHLARRHIRIADKRRDFHFQLAHDLFDQYDTVVFENLNMDGMKRLWGRKISDLGFTQFLQIVQWVAVKRGKRVVFIDRWERTTGKCSGCAHEQSLTLAERVFVWQRCGLTLDRDHNAAINVFGGGASPHTVSVGEAPASSTASGVHVSSSHL